MSEILYKRELAYWFNHWEVDGEWNTAPYYISTNQLIDLLDPNNCITIPIDCGFFRTHIDIKVDRASMLRSEVCVVTRTFLDNQLYKYQEEGKACYKVLKDLNDQYLSDIHHWQNKYNCMKEEYEALRKKVNE